MAGSVGLTVFTLQRPRLPLTTKKTKAASDNVITAMFIQQDKLRAK